MSLKEKILYFLNHNSFIKPKEQLVLFYIIIFITSIIICIFLLYYIYKSYKFKDNYKMLVN